MRTENTAPSAHSSRKSAAAARGVSPAWSRAHKQPSTGETGPGIARCRRLRSRPAEYRPGYRSGADLTALLSAASGDAETDQPAERRAYFLLNPYELIASITQGERHIIIQDLYKETTEISINISNILS